MLFHKLSLDWPGLQASLEAGQYDLASELLRFLIPPGDNDILAAMPSHAPMHDHSNGKHPQSAANQDAGVSLSHSDLSTLSDPPRLRRGLKRICQTGATSSALTQACSSTFALALFPSNFCHAFSKPVWVVYASNEDTQMQQLAAWQYS